MLAQLQDPSPNIYCTHPDMTIHPLDLKMIHPRMMFHLVIGRSEGLGHLGQAVSPDIAEAGVAHLKHCI